MGSEPSKKLDKTQEKQKFEIVCIKVKSYLELQRDRKQNEVSGKEKLLIKMINQPTRSKFDEFHKASSIVTDSNFVKACNIVLRFIEILRDRSMHIIESKGTPDKIEDLMPLIESICWSTQRLNLDSLKDFQQLMLNFYGPKVFESLKKSTRVDPDLIACFKNIIPTQEEVRNYMLSFSERTGLSLDQINQAGHNYESFHNDGGNNNFGGNNGGGNNNFGGGEIKPQENFVNIPQQNTQPINMQGFNNFQPPQFQPNQQNYTFSNQNSNNPQYQQPPVTFQPQQQQNLPNSQIYPTFQQQQQQNPNFSNPNNNLPTFNQQLPTSNQGNINSFNLPPSQNNNNFNLPQSHNNNFNLPPQNNNNFNLPPQNNNNFNLPPQNHNNNFNLPPQNNNNGNFVNPQNNQPNQKESSNLPSLNDIEERMKKLRGGN